jgi:hypothetical protein
MADSYVVVDGAASQALAVPDSQPPIAPQAELELAITGPPVDNMPTKIKIGKYVYSLDADPAWRTLNLKP